MDLAETLVSIMGQLLHASFHHDIGWGLPHFLGQSHLKVNADTQGMELQSHCKMSGHMDWWTISHLSSAYHIIKDFSAILIVPQCHLPRTWLIPNK